MSARTYRYGCRQPLDDVLPHIYAGHQYRNKLVEIELERRKHTDDYLVSVSPLLAKVESRLAAADEAVAALLTATKAANAKARTLTQTPADKAIMAELRESQRNYYTRRKEIRKELFGRDEVKAALEQVNQVAYAAIRAARAACGVYWGTYLLVEESASTFRSGAPPRFERWTGEGRIGVQLQGGLDWETLCAGTDTRLRLTPAPGPSAGELIHRFSVAGPKTQAKRRMLWMRIGSDGRAPIWAKIPVTIHREPPATAKIKWCVLHRRLVAGAEQWHVTFSLVAEHASAFSTRDLSPTGAVGIDVGYRVMSSGRQRVAIAFGTDGEQHDLYLPISKVCEWEKIERIQGYRDTGLDEAKTNLSNWLEIHENAPQWLRERCQYLAQWRSARRLDDLVYEWSQTTGVPEDGDIIRDLVAWRARERHLWQYQENLRQQLLAWRRNFYREWAAMLRKSYHTVYLEDIDLRDVIHDTLVPADLRETVTPQRRAANRVALSELNDSLKHCGMDSVRVPHAGTTAICHECRHVNDSDDPSRLKTCGGCGREYDRDENAARNILASGEAAQNNGGAFASPTGPGVTPSPAANGLSKRHAARVAARERRSVVKQSTEIG